MRSEFCITSPHYNTTLALMGIDTRGRSSPQAKVSIYREVACSVNTLRRRHRWPHPRSCCPQTRMAAGHLPLWPSEALSVSPCLRPEMSNIPAGDFSDLFQTFKTIWREIKEAGMKGPRKTAVRSSSMATKCHYTLICQIYLNQQNFPDVDQSGEK